MEPLGGEVRDQVLRPWVREHPGDLPVQLPRRAQSAGRREVQQLVVRNAAPQEEGEP